MILSRRNIVLDVPLDRRRSSIISRAELNRITSIDFNERFKARSLSSPVPPIFSPASEKRFSASMGGEKRNQSRRKDSDEPLHSSLTDLRELDGRKTRVLVAEDNKLNQVLIKTMLTTLNYEVFSQIFPHSVLFSSHFVQIPSL